MAINVIQHIMQLIGPRNSQLLQLTKEAEYETSPQVKMQNHDAAKCWKRRWKSKHILLPIVFSTRPLLTGKNREEYQYLFSTPYVILHQFF